MLELLYEVDIRCDKVKEINQKLLIKLIPWYGSKFFFNFLYGKFIYQI